MLSMEKFKQSLGSQVKNLDDQDIEKLRDQHDKLAELLFNFWLEEKNEKTTSKN